MRCFNSRTLGRVRLGLISATNKGSIVSIHAPWEGCDPKRSIPIVGACEFHFTHPGKGATVLPIV